MNADKIQDLINEENNTREYNVAQSARSIIKQIVDEQGGIASSNKRIEELRAELKALSHEPLNLTQIIG